MEVQSARRPDKVEIDDVQLSATNKAVFANKVQESNQAISNGDFRRAVQLYTEAISFDPSNHILYTNRSAAYAKLHQYMESLEDARKAKRINSGWSKAYLREGTALHHLGQHGEALASFASGLAQEAGNSNLVTALVDTALKSPLKDKLGPIFQQLHKMRLDQSPFVIIAVIGQELLAAGHYSASVIMLESALSIGSSSLKLRGSVYSALSSAYWGTGNIEKAILYMQEDLNIAKTMGDQEGECRAYGNLGSAHFSKGCYREALSNHRFQLVLAMKLKDRQTAAVALSSLGHVYTAVGDYPNALASHKQCVLLCRQSSDKLSEAREIGNVGAVYLAMGNFPCAIECHNEHMKISKNLKSHTEEARAYSNLGSAYHYKRDYEKAIGFHNQVLKIAEQRSDKKLEARAYAGLGHAARCKSDYSLSKHYHEKQLDNALQTRDKVAEGRACANLGIIYHHLCEYEAALKLHVMHLKLSKRLGDRASEGRANGNIGNAYSALGQHEVALRFHKQELAISTEISDRHSEMSTHGNLAVAYQAVGILDKALHHFLCHLNISKELKDAVSEARALCNLGNFYSMKENYSEAIPYYEQYLSLSQELNDHVGEAKACFNIGYAYSLLGNYPEALNFYEQHLLVAKELHDKLEIARAYCNLGLAHKALQNHHDAFDYQKKALALMRSLRNVKGIFKVLGNMGDVLLKMGEVSEAVQVYNQQLQLAKQCKNQDLTATAYGALGTSHRIMGHFDKALGFHNQEFTIRQEMNDLKGECRAHGNMGNVHMCLGNYSNALKCYEEQLKLSQELHDSGLEAQACGNLGITKMNAGHFDEAIGLFEQQLAMLEQLHGNNVLVEKGKAFGNLGDCYEALNDYEESVKCHNQYLAIAQTGSSFLDEDKAYRGLGNAHRSMGNLQQALVCFEKRLVVAHKMDNAQAKASAYGELGCLHSLLGNFEQAISCLEHQLNIAVEMGDRLCEGEAACGLGNVYQQMGEYETALSYHQTDLKIAESLDNSEAQCRAYGNLGLSHESLGNSEEAVRYQELHLSMAAQLSDKVAKTMAYSSLGRVHHVLGNYTQAVQYLQQGLQIAEHLGRREDEAKIRYRLGLSLWGKGKLDDCQQQLYRAADLFEMIRRESQCGSDYKLSLFDLQTACYQALQRVLVSVGQHEEALVVAERACTRAFIDLLLERQAEASGLLGEGTNDLSPITLEHILSTVSRQRNTVLCYSIAAGYLYMWLITPKDGIVKFHQYNMAEVDSSVATDSDTHSLAGSTVSILDQYVGDIRESMGVESHDPSGSSVRLSRSCSKMALNGVETDSEDNWQQQLEELGDKLNAENDRTGFLRMVNRNHIFNCSNYSLSSLFSLSAGLNGLNLSSMNLRNAMKNKQKNKAALCALYDLLISPMEDAILASMDSPEPGNLVLVLQADLYLVPFAVLRPEETSNYLCERFGLTVVPSITSLRAEQRQSKHKRPSIDSSGAVVIGNPKLTPCIQQQWQLKDIPGSEYEARIVAELLTVKPLIGSEATKAFILHQLEQVEVIHFSAHVSWKLSAIILAPGELTSSSSSSRFNTFDLDDSSSDVTALDTPSLAEYLLTAADILNLRLRAKLVVLNSGHTDDRAGRINSDGVVGLTRAFLSAGAGCVLYSLWPVPDQASKLLMKTLYVALQEGQSMSKALLQGIHAVQSVKQFSHPANWGGWVLVGNDIRLSSKVAQMGHAICEILQFPSHCRESLRVLLHLIEKSLQRIHQGAKNPMYTTYQSIENKVGSIAGWKDLLQAVGFRFEPSTNGLPAAVFFPQTDPGDRLTQASASLQALLGLPSNSIPALSKFLSNYEAGEAIISTLRDIVNRVIAKESSIEVPINVKLWQVPGCHEFLASLGFDLVGVGKEDVTLRLGKQASKRHLQFAVQSLVAVFDTQDAPKSLTLDSSSSMESLSSSHSSSNTSASTLSNFGSTPPLSPRGRKRSIFNPAEMERIRSHTKFHLMHQGGLVGKSRHFRSNNPDPALYLSHQSRIKAMYPPETYQFRSPATSPESFASFSSSSSPEELANLATQQNRLVAANSNGSQPVAKSNLVYLNNSQQSLKKNSCCLDCSQPKMEPKANYSDNSQPIKMHCLSQENNKSPAEMDISMSREEGTTEILDKMERLSPSCTAGIKGGPLPVRTVRNPSNHNKLLTGSNHNNLQSFVSTSSSPFQQPIDKKMHGEESKKALTSQNIAEKVLADVARQREAVEQLQKVSLMHSRKKTHALRHDFQQKTSSDNRSQSSQSPSSGGSSTKNSPVCDIFSAPLKHSPSNRYSPNSVSPSSDSFMSNCVSGKTPSPLNRYSSDTTHRQMPSPSGRFSPEINHTAGLLNRYSPSATNMNVHSLTNTHPPDLTSRHIPNLLKRSTLDMASKHIPSLSNRQYSPDASDVPGLLNRYPPNVAEDQVSVLIARLSPESESQHKQSLPNRLPSDRTNKALSSSASQHLMSSAEPLPNSLPHPSQSIQEKNPLISDVLNSSENLLSQIPCSSSPQQPLLVTSRSHSAAPANIQKKPPVPAKPLVRPGSSSLMKNTPFKNLDINSKQTSNKCRAAPNSINEGKKENHATALDPCCSNIFDTVVVVHAENSIPKSNSLPFSSFRPQTVGLIKSTVGNNPLSADENVYSTVEPRPQMCLRAETLNSKQNSYLSAVQKPQRNSLKRVSFKEPDDEVEILVDDYQFNHTAAVPEVVGSSSSLDNSAKLRQLNQQNCEKSQGRIHTQFDHHNSRTDSCERNSEAISNGTPLHLSSLSDPSLHRPQERFISKGKLLHGKSRVLQISKC